MEDSIREKQAIRMKRINRDKRLAAKEFLNEFKESHPCADCGGYFPFYVMDFDHLGDKKFNINRKVQSGPTIAFLMIEIDKCDTVCSNCHRIRTYKRLIGDL